MDTLNLQYGDEIRFTRAETGEKRDRIYKVLYADVAEVSLSFRNRVFTMTAKAAKLLGIQRHSTIWTQMDVT